MVTHQPMLISQSPPCCVSQHGFTFCICLQIRHIHREQYDAVHVLKWTQIERWGRKFTTPLRPVGWKISLISGVSGSRAGYCTQPPSEAQQGDLLSVRGQFINGRHFITHSNNMYFLSIRFYLTYFLVLCCILKLLILMKNTLLSQYQVN